MNSIETGDATAIAYVNPDKYIQHDLALAEGLASFGAELQALSVGPWQLCVGG